MRGLLPSVAGQFTSEMLNDGRRQASHPTSNAHLNPRTPWIRRGFQIIYSETFTRLLLTDCSTGIAKQKRSATLVLAPAVETLATLLRRQTQAFKLAYALTPVKRTSVAVSSGKSYCRGVKSLCQRDKTQWQLDKTCCRGDKGNGWSNKQAKHIQAFSPWLLT